MEPLPEERKNRWRREMDWLLSPTSYMVELVPAKQNGTNGRSLEVCLVTDGLQRVTLCVLYNLLIFRVDVEIEADNDSKGPCRHPSESSRTSEVGLYAYCR